MSQTFGRTRWKRFAVAMVPSVAATAVIGVSIAQGALAASFSVSGQRFKVAAGKLVGSGFAQYGSIDVEKAGVTHPVAVSSFEEATIDDLCQSVVVPTPIGDVSLDIEAGGGATPVTARNLFIDLDDLRADAKFTNIDIGVATGGVTKGLVNPDDRAAAPDRAKFDDSFAQQADSATLTGVRQTAWATSAGTFRLSDLHMSVNPGDHECY